jgi:SGNH hydrolase-like domain, acetyltransferase AlgX
LEATDRVNDPGPRGFVRQTTKMLLVVSGLAAAVTCLTLAGGLDGLADDGRANVDRVVTSVAVYWGLACLLILVIAGLRCKPQQTILSLLSVVFALLSAEVVLRLTYPRCWRSFVQAPSPEYHHINVPSQRMFFADVQGKRVFVTTNEDGFRSHYTRQEFLTHKQRVAAMGDSFTFGFGVRQTAAFPQVMERLLHDELSRKDIAVLNAGIVSYSPLLARRLFDGVVRHYRPTLVLYFLDASDIGDDYKYAQSLVTSGGRTYFDVRKASTPSYYGAVAKIIHLDALVADGLWPLQWLMCRLSGERGPKPEHYDWYDFRLRIGNCVETNRFFIYRHPLDETKPHFEKTFGHIQALADAVRAAGAGFVLVVLPRFHHWNREECPDNWEARSYSLEEPYSYEFFRFFDSKKADASFEILNLLPFFQATHKFPLVFRKDPHWNEAGHAFVARTIASHLIQTRRFE